MDNKKFSLKITEYAVYLKSVERSKNTIIKYTRDLQKFLTYWEEGELRKEIVLDWKKQLIEGYAPASVNSMLVVVNVFLTGWIYRK